jgi:hypothetical protein
VVATGELLLEGEHDVEIREDPIRASKPHRRVQQRPRLGKFNRLLLLIDPHCGFVCVMLQLSRPNGVRERKGGSLV